MYSLLLFYNYANSDISKLRKAIGLSIHHKDGMSGTITEFDDEDIFIGQTRWAWLTLLEYFTHIDLNYSLTLEIYEYFQNNKLIDSLELEVQCWLKKNILDCKEEIDCWSKINNLLEKELFKEAGELYTNSCIKHISAIEYKRKYDLYFQKYCKLQKPLLIGTIETLLKQSQFKEATILYQNKCSKIIGQSEFDSIIRE